MNPIKISKITSRYESGLLSAGEAANDSPVFRRDFRWTARRHRLLSRRNSGPLDRRDKHAIGKALAQIVRTEMIGTTGGKWETREKSRASAKRASVGRVYREVSFN